MKRGILLSLALLATAFAMQHSTQDAQAVGEGVFQLDATEYATAEGTAVLVTVQRTQGGTLTVDVDVTLAVDGNTDFDIPTSEVSKKITFAKNTNESSKSVFIQTLNKEQFADRDIQVTILSVSNGGILPLGGRTTAPITLLGSGTPRVFDVSPDSGGDYATDFTILTVTGENFIYSGATYNAIVTDVQFFPMLGPDLIVGAPVTVASGDVFDLTPTSLKVKVPGINPALSDFAFNQLNQPAATYHVRVNVNTTPAQVPSATGLSPKTPNDQYVATSGPTVTGLSVRQGPPTGGTQVVVSGTKFLPHGAPNTNCFPTIPLSTVQIGGIDVTACKFGAPGQLIVTTPAHISGLVDAVVTYGGIKSPTVIDSHYNYQGVPIINSLTPNFGPQAGGGTVLISGSGFFIGSLQPSAVLFGGNAATFTLVSDTQILATVPPGTGLQQVKIIHPISGTSDFRTQANYTYSPGPLINGLSPSHGPAVGGTIVTISGAGFAPGAVVKFGELQAFATVLNENSISATAPAGSGVVTVSVSVNTNVSPPGPQAQYSYDGPTVTSVAPIAGPIAGGTPITIRGTNFTTASLVTIGTATVVPVFVDPTTLTMVTPATPAAQAAHVRVTTGSGQSPESPVDVFTYTNGPIVDGINPDNGPTTGGTIVVITGKNFSAPLSVSFGAIPATSFNVNSATQITVLTPPNPTAGPADVRVTKGADVSPVGPKTKFTYITSTPKVTQLTPNTGSTFGGTEITITGIGLSGAVCPGSVKFGSVPASSCTVVNDSTITTTAPPNVSGITVVTITTANGTSDIVPNYTYVSPNAPGGGTAPPAPGPGGTTTYTLHTRWTLLTWTGASGVKVSDAIRGTGIPGATDLSTRISAIYLWDAATATWKAYFTGAEGVPGASDFTQFTPGAVYWVAVLGTGELPWVVSVPP